MELNKEGLALMANDLPMEARPHFESFVNEVSKVTFNEDTKLSSAIPLKSPQVLHLRAFKRFDDVCIHARIYVKGTYGKLFN